MIKVLIPNLKQTIYKVSLEHLLYKKRKKVPKCQWTHTKVTGTTLKGLIKFETTQSSKKNNANTGFPGGSVVRNHLSMQETWV